MAGGSELPRQSRELHDRPLAAGVPVRLVMVGNSGYGFVPEGGQASPSRAEISLAVENFFQDTLE